MKTNKIRNLITKNWILIVIILLASALRLINLAGNPPHLTPDEASLGYNAYSILKTGKDEYGTTLPLVFKSFGDYKPGLYVYTAIPVVAIFGLNEFSTRLPSVVFGIISVILIYLIVNKLFGDKRLAHICGFLLAINPWHMHFSRGAWEINLALMLTLAGIYFFFESLKKIKFIIPSGIFFALTLLAYQGAKLSTGIVVLILLVLYGKKLINKKNIKVIVIAALIGFIISIPVTASLFTGKTGRLTVFSVFSYPRPEKYLQDFLDQGNEHKSDLSYYLFHSESLNFFRGVMGRYFNHFSGKFLFFVGDWANPRHSAPNHGMLLLADSILLILGVFAIVRKKTSRELLFVILWCILAPLPSVLSRDQVHAVRAFNLVIPLTIIACFGVNLLISNYRKVAVLFAGVYLLNYIFFLDAYFIHLPRHTSQLWEYGYKQIVETILPIQDKYKTIKVQQSYAQPYIYFLFYSKFDPAKYQANAKLTENQYGDVGQVEKLDNICFCALDWSRNRGEKNTLFVGDPIRIPPQDSQDGPEFSVIDEIKYLDGDTAFRIIEVK